MSVAAHTGIAEVQHFYKQALANLQLYGPTNFAEFINKTADVVRAAHISQQEQQYFVLLVLTDGVITDMEDTVSAIVAASELPLSIIIVGVGEHAGLPTLCFVHLYVWFCSSERLST